ncbi:hypothetical protein EP073_06490 [Geovibrio thiophilus]|uniref:Uncharacterized protein n=1 Tax=Geovibrio thiophilus TaxID=139438 RepID=A0A410JXY0_9BACT|nr:hypothetical protein [Geovibrio thiophilus]QAR33066.1 hypothetical protein EP073_06490 [Geovibrio thiophilus]
MNKAKVGLHNKGLFPAFLDYNVTELRCRGMSSKLDLFYYGGLNRVLSALNPKERSFIKEEWLFLRSTGFFEESGFFVTDFQSIAPAKFAEKVMDAGFKKIYLENALNFDVKELQDELKGVEIVFMEFADDPYRKS